MMKNGVFVGVLKYGLLIFLVFLSITLSAQITPQSEPKSDFWQRVQFGGIVGASVGSGYTDVTLAPSGIYNFNPYFAAGVGLQGTYVRVKNSYEAYIYGGSIIGLFNPIEQIQVSAELEQVRVNRNFVGAFDSDNFWNTALFLGAGYHVQNVTIGARYNVLYNENDFVYSDAFMPFVRVYF
jgi:hypothetical protein